MFNDTIMRYAANMNIDLILVIVCADGNQNSITSLAIIDIVDTFTTGSYIYI